MFGNSVITCLRAVWRLETVFINFSSLLIPFLASLILPMCFLRDKDEAFVSFCVVRAVSYNLQQLLEPIIESKMKVLCKLACASAEILHTNSAYSVRSVSNSRLISCNTLYRRNENQIHTNYQTIPKKFQMRSLNWSKYEIMGGKNPYKAIDSYGSLIS